MKLLYLLIALALIAVVLTKITYRRAHPWREITPLRNDERYLTWIDRHAEYERRMRIKKAQQRMRVLARLDQRYANRASVHVPAPRGSCQ